MKGLRLLDKLCCEGERAGEQGKVFGTGDFYGPELPDVVVDDLRIEKEKPFLPEAPNEMHKGKF